MLQTRQNSIPASRGAAGAHSFEVPFACSQGCRFFEQCATKAADLPTQGPLMKFARHQPIFTEGDVAHHCYKVIEGAVRTSRILSDGHRQILEFFLPGDTFGIEVTRTYGATAEAVGEVVLLRCPRTCIDKQSELDHARDMVQMLSRSLCAAQDHVAMLGHQGAKERVANFLLKLARGQGRCAGEALELPIGRQDIADYLGLTVETTCRTLSDFKATHIITAPNRHQIVIRNMERMEEIADGCED
jgi:CRP-like cAMP-binding protein